MEDFLISRSFLEAIGWMVIARYAAVLVLELGICILLFDAKIARRAFLVVTGLLLLGVFLRDPVLCGIWFNLAIIVTGVFANTKLGFAVNNLNPQQKNQSCPSEFDRMVGSLYIDLYSMDWFHCCFGGIAGAANSSKENMVFKSRTKWRHRAFLQRRKRIFQYTNIKR
ncbi:MAG: hypothetical protein HYZ25_08425 [Chloroflexi bacterium]|nr:hypothetical protein [Chloroflexota bacterium]